MTSVFKLPLLGETMERGRVALWLKRPGDSFARGETILEVETDKTVVEVPALGDGMLVEIIADEGAELKVGEPLCVIDGGALPDVAAPAAPAPPPVPEEAPRAAPTPPPRHATAPPQAQPRVRATPRARRLAQQLGIDVAEVVGGGRRGRVEVRDVLARGDVAKRAGAGETASAEPVAADAAKFGPVELHSLSRIQRISGERLHGAWVSIPHVTHFDDADVTDLEAFRKTLDGEARADAAAPYRVSLLPFLMKAAVVALKAFPAFNSILSPGGDALVRRLYWHIGFAVDTPDGLVVAVVRDVDRKGVTQLARELDGLSGRAREGRLAPDELQGSTFTISSLGGIGGSGFTPIINAPEVAILGVSRTRVCPVWDGKAFAPRLMLPLSLSYDHRVIDGAAAARFMRRFCRDVEDVRRMLL